MISELLAVVLVVSACLAVYLDEAIHSVASLACVFTLTAILYASTGAIFVAVFQLAVGAGTLAVLFLSAEMLSEKTSRRKTLRSVLPVVAVASLLSLPSVFLSVEVAPANVSSGVSFGQALWDLRAVDVVLQGLVMVTVAVGTAIVLHKREEGEG